MTTEFYGPLTAQAPSGGVRLFMISVRWIPIVRAFPPHLSFAMVPDTSEAVGARRRWSALKFWLRLQESWFRSLCATQRNKWSDGQ
jgi:hypothetical protein